ncbi:MAG: hypothetical protein F6K50_37390 [Moorea sp. SIO3I7]|uniref:Uncharacterized protein n=1 Tax=Moorena bouillonii PNG TaxID=568701 RepID=A0A1U7MXK9_9CYAN|nr:MULTISPECIES: hypothetical protein [Moorena]NEO00896.1 hypothetical protein [Moorena sp. SIO3I7]NEO59930.1 hypothetical protein [Moorena sp. SIO4G2]NEO16395.1 hypothetical protein [Moorena sp. SIO3E8]NEP29674.1 hypothetical protein [Moorena sp. SIO3I6]NEQ02956.1 hypothetical protein [Moorena sp. SIO3F7]
MTSTNGDYYLVVPYKTTQGETENQGRVVALDPGVRTVLMQSLMGETTAVAHGGDPQDRAASPRPRCIAF